MKIHPHAGLMINMVRIYHPNHGILIIGDKADQYRLLSTGGVIFNVEDKPWLKAKETPKDQSSQASQENTEPKVKRLGRPKKWQ